MTALKQYSRLEATALWRENPDAQRREVVVSLGDATLTISTLSDQALAHWSLAAIERAPGRGTPAIYHPDGDASETLELEADDMIAAIEQLRGAVKRARPTPGRLRWLGAALSAGAVAALCLFWLPGALVRHALSVVPEVSRAEIGEAVLTRMARVTGQPCSAGAAAQGLAALEDRTGVARISVLPAMVQPTLALPGGRVLLARTVVEDHETPDVVAGYVLAEALRMETVPPLRALLEAGGLRASVTLLTTGHLPEAVLDDFATRSLGAPRPAVATDKLLTAFAARGLASSPYAYALDVSGERSLPLIEGDPAQGDPVRPIMPDAAWLRLQSICGG